MAASEVLRDLRLLDCEELGSLSDPEPQDTRYGTVQYQTWDGACLILIRHITSQIELELVGIEKKPPK